MPQIVILGSKSGVDRWRRNANTVIGTKNSSPYFERGENINFFFHSTTGKLPYCSYCNEKLVLEAFLEAALAQSSILICSPD